VARDRQRAKQRRRNRQPGAGGPAAGSARTRARDIGLEPTDAELDSTPAPEPTKHAFPDVEEARMAEAGATPPDVGEELPEFDSEGEFVGERDVAAAPDDLERDRDLASASSVRREAERMAREDAETHDRRVGRGKLLTFLGHVIDELRRVQWPDRRQVGQGTAVTLGFVVLAGGYLGLLDAIWKPLIEAIL
jgi:preprotein translocase SecE subunit